MSMSNIIDCLEALGGDFSNFREDVAKSNDNFKKKREKLEQEAGGFLKKCSLCGNAGYKLCTGCYSKFYCTDICQQEEWKKFHKSECKGLRRANFKVVILVPPSDVL